MCKKHKNKSPDRTRPFVFLVGVALRPPPVADKGSIALSEITSKRQYIYVQRIATIFQTGGHWTPALMWIYVCKKSFDIINVMYSFVAANIVRQSNRFCNRFDIIQIIGSLAYLKYSKIFVGIRFVFTNRMANTVRRYIELQKQLPFYCLTFLFFK